MVGGIQKILVIGSKGHDGVYCVDWLEPFPNIEEYDAVIINLQSLTQSVIDKLSKLSSGRLSQKRDEIYTLFKTNRETFCIVNERLTPDTGGHITKLSEVLGNYDWLFIDPYINIEKRLGTSVTIKNERFEEYLKQVKKWFYEISLKSSYIDDGGHFREVPDYFGLIPIAVNKSEKMIACSFIIKGREGRINLLPPTTECDSKKAVEILIDIASKKRRIHPSWRNTIKIPGLNDFEQEIKKRKQCTGDLENEIKRLEQSWGDRESYRGLLEADDCALVDIVQRALSDMGINTKKTRPGFVVDLISKDVAVEVTGTNNKIDVQSRKFSQILEFYERNRKNEKVILIANTYKHLPPSQRHGKMNFTPQVVETLKPKGVCLITTLTLLKLWTKLVNKKTTSQNVINKIMKTKGELGF